MLNRTKQNFYMTDIEDIDKYFPNCRKVIVGNVNFQIPNATKINIYY